MDAQVERLRALEAAGATQVNLYLLTPEKEASCEAYGRDVIPRCARRRDERLDPARTVRELRELRALTGDERAPSGSPGRTAGRARGAGSRALLDDLPVTREVDEAGNVWVTLQGRLAAGGR